MNSAPIADIKIKLRKTYPMFRFDIKPQYTENSYLISVYKMGERTRLGDLSIPETTPMDKFWEQIRAWMLPFIRNY
jgi:hypothetical protein